MRLVSYDGGFGRWEGDVVVPMGPSLIDYLRTGDGADEDPKAVSELRLRAPLPRPEKIVCIGLNYEDHAAEQGVAIPDEPVLFAKFPNSVIGHLEDIRVPPVAKKVDYEAELGVVIGRTCSSVSEDDALSYVAGYMCMNDVTARDLQFSSPQWMRGKAIDTFLPTGPYMTTSDEVDDPQSLAIRCLIGDEVLQDSSTAKMAFSVAQLISFISQTITLEAGDMIATGTPAGVGFAREPSRYLADGEEVSVEIERLGRLTNRVRVPVDRR
jgi:2-keto-4-pentenoate hydratase/2-oxohepta-3-ene-1,7-dioic acid hydratase in catechol pathway